MAGVDVSTRECDGQVVVALRGQLDMAEAAGAAAAFTAVAARGPRIIVDLAGLEFLPSPGWSMSSLFMRPWPRRPALPARAGAAAAAQPGQLAARRHAVRSASPGKGTPSAEEAGRSSGSVTPRSHGRARFHPVGFHNLVVTFDLLLFGWPPVAMLPVRIAALASATMMTRQPRVLASRAEDSQQTFVTVPVIRTVLMPRASSSDGSGQRPGKNAREAVFWPPLEPERETAGGVPLEEHRGQRRPAVGICGGRRGSQRPFGTKTLDLPNGIVAPPDRPRHPVLCQPCAGMTCCFTLGARAGPSRLPVRGPGVRLAGAAGAQ